MATAPSEACAQVASYSRRPHDEDQWHEKTTNLCLAMLTRFDIPELERLRKLREQGWEHSELDNHFKEQRAAADTSNDYLNRMWFFKMKRAFQELNDFAGFVPDVGPYKFLDLGCCPGGFSSYVLSTCAQATGLGISLPKEQGGHLFLLEQPLRGRYVVNYSDLLYYKLHRLATSKLKGRSLQPFPSAPQYRDFDLVILDGHFLRTYRTPGLCDPDAWDRHRLLISQIVIALRTIKQGGTIVMKLSHPEGLLTAKLLFFLDFIAADLRTYKPRTIHANRGTFYAIAQGVWNGSRGDKRDAYLQSFENLWYEITFGGDEGTGRYMTEEDLDFVITYDDLLSGSLERLAALGRDAWTVQADTLERWFGRKGLRIRNGPC